MNSGNYAQILIPLDWVCKCQNHDPDKFISEKKKNTVYLLCLECERKYEIKLMFSEKK